MTILSEKSDKNFLRGKRRNKFLDEGTRNSRTNLALTATITYAKGDLPLIIVALGICKF